MIGSKRKIEAETPHPEYPRRVSNKRTDTWTGRMVKRSCLASATITFGGLRKAQTFHHIFKNQGNLSNHLLV